MSLDDPQKGIQELDTGFGPSFCSCCETGIEYTSPDFESAIIRSLDIEREVKFFPRKVGVGCVVSFEKAVPHCNKSPLSSMAAPKVLSSLMSRSNFPSKKGIRWGDFIKVSFESGATTLPALDPHAYTPGFSQLFCTCKCCELMMFLLSSSDVAFRLGFSKFSSCCSCGGSSACTSRRNFSPLYHCHAVAVAQRAVTATTERTKCCWRRCAYG